MLRRLAERARRPCSLLLLSHHSPPPPPVAAAAAVADALAARASAAPSSSSSSSSRRAWSSSPAAVEEEAVAVVKTTTTATTTTPAEIIEYMEFPGGRVPYTTRLRFVAGVGAPPDDDDNSAADRPGAVLPAWPPLSPTASSRPPRKIPCYRTLDVAGAPIAGADAPHDLDGDGDPQATAVRLYECMLRLQTMDAIFYEAQRQGRFSFYMTSAGEEASVVGAAAALRPDDVVMAQYREQGALMWRGYAPREFALQCFGSSEDASMGRQMPIHYGSARLRYHTVSSPLATQLPQAVGAAYAMRARGEARVAAAFFGEGAASEGDFHAAVNFAATLGAPALFLCRNNGYAISTPASEQYAGDGVAGRGPGYGVPSVRVDGGDARAVYNAVAAARALALERGGPVLVEAMSYRSGHHSTSDDSSRYRSTGEMAAWRARDPVVRLRNWLWHDRGWWDAEREAEARGRFRREAVDALEEGARAPRPSVSSMFDDVYAEVPWHLREQCEATLAFAKRHAGLVPPGVEVV